MVNKPCSTGRIVRWFILLLEFDFTVVVKKGTTHLRADHLSRITNGEEPIGVNNDLLDTYLFNIEMIPKWAERIVTLLTYGGTFDKREQTEKQSMLMYSKNFKLIVGGHLYHHEHDGIMRL